METDQDLSAVAGRYQRRLLCG